MKKKFLYGILLIILSIVFTISYTFAADENNAGTDVVNDIRNAVGATENGVENAARDISNTSKDATSDMENGGSDIINNNGDDANTTTGNTENSNNGNMGTNSNGTAMGTQGYNAQRTSTTDDNALFGMDSTTLIWIIMAIVAIAIVALVFYYSAGVTNKNNYNDDDE